MRPVTGGGSFTRQNIATINSNFQSLVNPDLWVRPQGPGANNTNPGTYESPLADMTGTSQYLKPGIVVGLEGVLFQNWAPPAVNDVTIIGMANTPRQATDSGIPNGGGATWLSASGTPATSLLKIGGAATETKESQGWRIENIYFNNSSTTATTGCIELLRGDGSGVDVGRDASHASIINCKFTGGNYGILDQGGASFITVDGCEFFNFTGSGDTAIKAGTATDVALPLQWNIKNSSFWNNANSIVSALSSANIQNNNFGYIGSSITATTLIVLTGGKNNAIWNNKMGLASNTAGINLVVVLGTADSYGPQFYTDMTEYAAPTS